MSDRVVEALEAAGDEACDEELLQHELARQLREHKGRSEQAHLATLNALHERKRSAPALQLHHRSTHASTSSPRTGFTIMLVSDFFYPRLGGVELHQYQLAQALISRGHKVIILTNTYKDAKGRNVRQGVRYMTNGLKVYYTPIMAIQQQASLLLLFSFLPIFRSVVIRERVQIVHGHQTTSALAHECMLHAHSMGLKVVYTDHSLFCFASPAAINLNKLLRFSLCTAQHVIGVSHCSKENMVLRAELNPHQVSVIPNALDTTKFTPKPAAAPNVKDRINIVILSRLVYRKGIDLAVEVVPRICSQFPKVHFIIGGDGPKRLRVEEMVEKYQLHDRVELLGEVPHSEVRNVLVRGHIFLNCSLTEAFCIAILEAVSSGLFVVSTRVGGVSEILPKDMIRFAKPDAADIIEVLSDAIPHCANINPMELHQRVRDMYNWYDVAERTECVYRSVSQLPPQSLYQRLCLYYHCGPWAGKLFCLAAACDYLLWRLLEWLMPASEIDEAPNFPVLYYHEVMDKL